VPIFPEKFKSADGSISSRDSNMRHFAAYVPLAFVFFTATGGDRVPFKSTLQGTGHKPGDN
jgi:hypothetical protein